jgi:hypothetical protein
MTNKAVTKSVAGTKIASVALQQGSGKYAGLTNKQLHTEMLEIRGSFFNRCAEAQTYGINALLPACEEIIARYKMPGVGAKGRPNGRPTVEAYFKSIKLNYNTVRSWIRRKTLTLSTEMFDPTETTSNNKDGKVPHLPRLVAQFLGSMSAGHDLVKAIRHGGNVDEAMKDFEEYAPTPQLIEEYFESSVKVATTELEKMAVRLCKVIDRNDSKNGQKILALARELLAKAEPITVKQVLAEESKRPQTEARLLIARRAA